MAELNITNLDFADIKANLRTYLTSQSEFSDYDFSGSALNVLLDVLAYNTHYNAVLANLVANEMFIDTALKRSSVVSLAKTLGYVPRSTTSSKARVTLSVEKTLENESTLLSIGLNNKFSASINNTSYIFNVNEIQTASLNTENKFVFTDVELIEGNRVSNTFSITPDLLSGPLIIPNENVDTTTIKVLVYESSTSLVPETYTKQINIVDVTSTSKVYWVEETGEGTYQIIFGDDNIGAKLTAGNVVVVSYVASSGSASNGARNFTLIGNIDGEDTVSITILSAATGGTEKESTDSVRFNAPRFNATRNRAVTSEDYRTLIKQNFTKAREVTVWGGEENVPPIYGKVFISIDPVTGAIISQSDKDYITETILRPRSVMSIQHEFVDPDYVYLGIEGLINFNARLTPMSATTLSSLVESDIEDYFDTEFGTLNKTFFLSRLSERVKQLSSAIVSSLFKLRLQKRLDIISNATSGYTKNLNYLAAIDPETIRSSNFVTNINGINYTGYMQDFSDDLVENENGTGTLKFINLDTNQPVKNVGTVDYAKGIVSINNLNVSRYLGNINQVYLYLRPQSLHQNISSSVVRASDTSIFAVSALPSKNTIITLDDSASNSVANILPGLVINSRPFSE